MVLVVGATGAVGSDVCRRLMSQGQRVRGMVRATSDPAKVDALRRAGVTTVQGDLKDRPSLDSACAGADVVISTASATISRQPGDNIESVDLAGQVALVDAAKAAGVKQFTYVSFQDHPDIEFPLQTAKRAVERQIRESGMNWTIFQPSLFMEVWLTAHVGFDVANATVRIFGTGENKISWISSRDVAAFIALAPGYDKAKNRTIPLGGPDQLSPLEVVRNFESLSGRKFHVEHVPESALKQQLTNAPDSLAKTLAGLGLFAAQGDTVDMRPVLCEFPVELTSVRDYAGQVLQKQSSAA